MNKEICPEWADEKYVTRIFGITYTPLYNLRKGDSSVPRALVYQERIMANASITLAASVSFLELRRLKRADRRCLKITIPANAQRIHDLRNAESDTTPPEAVRGKFPSFRQHQHMP